MGRGVKRPWGGSTSLSPPPDNLGGGLFPSCYRPLLLSSPLPPWAIRYVKTTANATVDHLSKYLALRIALEEEAPDPGPEPPALEDVSEKQYTIYITTAGGAFTVRVGQTGRFGGVP